MPLLKFNELLTELAGYTLIVDATRDRLAIRGGNAISMHARLTLKVQSTRDALLAYAWQRAKPDDDPRCPACPRRGEPTGEVLRDDITGEEHEILCDAVRCPSGQEREVEL